MQKWEYKIISVEKVFYTNNADKEIEKALNEMEKKAGNLSVTCLSRHICLL